MYRSPKLFKEPLSFIPERWTGDQRFVNDKLTAVQPFSVGPRNCLGKKYVVNALWLALPFATKLIEFQYGSA
jgi:cytochrome P450